MGPAGRLLTGGAGLSPREAEAPRIVTGGVSNKDVSKEQITELLPAVSRSGVLKRRTSHTL